MLVMIMAMMTMRMTTSHSSSLTLHSSPFQPSSQWHLAVVMSTSSDQFKEGLVIWLNENGIKGKHQTRHARVDVATQVSLNDRIIEKVRHPSVGDICLISRYRIRKTFVEKWNRPAPTIFSMATAQNRTDAENIGI